jgi:hypothetical protein
MPFKGFSNHQPQNIVNAFSSHTPFYGFGNKTRQNRPGPARMDIFRRWVAAILVADKVSKLSLFKWISPDEFESGLLKELYQATLIQARQHNLV